jgi:hypothetical protein
VAGRIESAGALEQSDGARGRKFGNEIVYRVDKLLFVTIVERRPQVRKPFLPV